jgi:hypothetical protein
MGAAFCSDELGEFLLPYESPIRDGNIETLAPENQSRSRDRLTGHPP